MPFSRSANERYFVFITCIHGCPGTLQTILRKLFLGTMLTLKMHVMWYIQQVKQRVTILQKLSTTDFCNGGSEYAEKKPYEGIHIKNVQKILRL